MAASTTATAPGLPFNINVPDQGGQSGLAAGFAIPVALPTTVPFLGTIRELDFTLRATVNAAATGMLCNSASITGGGASTTVSPNPCSTVPAPQLATPELETTSAWLPPPSAKYSRAGNAATADGSCSVIMLP